MAHLCNGLDPVRDGGMVPSILGMTGSLVQSGEEVTVLTATRSYLENTIVEPRLTVKGPASKLSTAIRSADLVHIHGLWQRHTRYGAKEARSTSSALPHRGSWHG